MRLLSHQDWYPTFVSLAGVDPSDPVTMQGKVRDIDGVNMWPALSGKNATSPRPILPTTQWSLLHDRRESGGRLLKIITGSYRSNWFLANGSQVNDTDTPCVEGEASGVPEAGILPCPGLVSASTATPEADQRVSASRISELACLRHAGHSSVPEGLRRVPCLLCVQAVPLR